MGLRERCLSSLAESFDLRFWNTWMNGSPASGGFHIHKAWNGGRLGQIDYVLAPRDFVVSDSWVFDVACGTYHRAVAITVSMKFPESRKNSKRSAKTRYMPEGDEADPGSYVAKFGAKVSADLCTLECRDGAIQSDQFANAVSGAAKSHGAHRSQGPTGVSAASRDQLRELERLRRISTCEIERTRLTKQIWGLRRQRKRLREAAFLDFYTSTGRARAWRQRSNTSTAQSLD